MDGETTGAEADAVLGEIMQVSWPYCVSRSRRAHRPAAVSVLRGAAVEASAALFTHGRYAEIADAGHFVWVERPAATRTAILQFLRDMGAIPDCPPAPKDRRERRPCRRSVRGRC